MTDTRAALDARKAQLFARTTDAALIGALRIIRTATCTTPEESMVRAWTIDEAERRFPAASAAVEAAFEADDARIQAGIDGPEIDYIAVLLANIPTVKTGA